MEHFRRSGGVRWPVGRPLPARWSSCDCAARAYRIRVAEGGLSTQILRTNSLVFAADDGEFAVAHRDDPKRKKQKKSPDFTFPTNLGLGSTARDLHA